MGVADTYMDANGHPTRYYVITPAGRSVAGHLSHANRIILESQRGQDAVDEQYGIVLEIGILDDGSFVRNR